MTRYFISFLVLTFCLQSFAGDPQLENLVHKAYVYQVQSMKKVNWMYIGYSPRMMDPDKISVTFSKATFSMRVTVKLTKEDLADYPRYLVDKAYQMGLIVDSLDLQIYQWWRINQFFADAERTRTQYDMSQSYREAKYRDGLRLLKEKFPSNVFEYPDVVNKGQTDVVAVAHFVYPITINKGGKGWPHDGVFTQKKQGFSKPAYATQERRTDHGKRVDTNGDGVKDTRVITDYIFSGFPAFWIDSSGKGTGVHGPIRFSRPSEKRRSRKSCKSYPSKMKDFWSQNEFREQDMQRDLQQDLPSIRYRWDLIRTNNSAGCFRAEPMELRHLLPASTVVIWESVKWTVTSDLDKIQVPLTGEWKYVDVNYYITDHYSCPLTREAWVKNRILPLNRGKSDPKTVGEFIEKSHQFEYLDPATIEYHHSTSFRARHSYKSMEALNKAGTHEDIMGAVLKLVEEVLPKSKKITDI